MKNFLQFLASLGFAAAVAFWINYELAQNDDPGYVLIGFGHWSLESTLSAFVMTAVIGFFLLYLFFRSMGWLLRMPGRMRLRSQNIKFNRSQEALVAGLVDSAEGNWERAEKVLIKHAGNSGAPLLHYLTAARAAHSRGAAEKRDEYLKKAAEQTSEDDLVVGLTQAELHLSDQQFSEALATLSRLHSINPSHASVLKLMHQAYHRLGDWEGLSKLLPSLRQHKIIMEAEVKLMETETHSRLLRQAAASGQIEAIQNSWDNVPGHIKTVPGVAAIYFAAMLSHGADAQIEQTLVATIVKQWDSTLLMLYANLKSPEPQKQLQTAEQWLAVYPADAVLYRVLGKLSQQTEQLEKAQQYLLKSLSIDPSVGAYQMLGELALTKGDKDKACDYFKQALELASNQVVNSVETISG